MDQVIISTDRTVYIDSHYLFLYIKDFLEVPTRSKKRASLSSKHILHRTIGMAIGYRDNLFVGYRVEFGDGGVVATYSEGYTWYDTSY